MPLRAFPALDQHEFRDACLALLRSLESVDLVVDPTDHLEVELRSHNNASYLQIMRRVVVGSPSPSCGRPPCQPSEDEPGEDDQDYVCLKLRAVLGRN